MDGFLGQLVTPVCDFVKFLRNYKHEAGSMLALMEKVQMFLAHVVRERYYEQSKDAPNMKIRLYGVRVAANLKELDVYISTLYPNVKDAKDTKDAFKKAAFTTNLEARIEKISSMVDALFDACVVLITEMETSGYRCSDEQKDEPKLQDWEIKELEELKAVMKQD